MIKNIVHCLKKGMVTAFFALCLLGFTSCGKDAKVSQDILSQKESDPEKTQISVLVKYAFSINGFEKAVEEKFPDIDIVQVGNYTRDMGTAEYKRRLEHNDLTDVVMTWPLEIGEEYWSDCLMDLSGMEFTDRYNLSMLNDIAKDGKLYYLPGPSQIRGIVYNKTLFEEKGWKVPNSFESFVQLCKTIEASGMRSLQLGFANSEVLDTAFVGYNYANYFSKPEDIQWIDNYNAGEGSFGDHFTTALEVFQRMIDEGIWKKSDLKVDYSIRETQLFTRQCAMVEDSVLMARMGLQLTGTTDEFALMPFFNPSKESDWARLYMVCYIGLNKNLEEPQNKKKYDQVMKLMDYISSEEGQETLSMDTGAMFSSLIGVQSPNVPEIMDIIPALSHGRYTIFPRFKNMQSALREGLRGMVKGELTKEDVIKMVDAQNISPPVSTPPEVLGTASKDFSMIETGNFVTDAMRDQSGCEIALFMDNGKDGLYNGKGISGKFYAGDVTTEDVSCVMPDIKHGETGTLCKVTMTGAALLKTLEYSIPVNNDQGGWFYYFSGLTMEYAPSKEPGARIKSIKTTDGKSIDETKLYTIAVMDETVPEELIRDCTKTDVTITSIVEQAVRDAGKIAPDMDGRFKVIK